MQYEEFFRAHYGQLVGSLRKGGYERESEEAAQEAMFDAYRRWDAIHPHARRRWTWVAAFRIAERLRRQRARFRGLLPEEDVPDAGAGPEQLAEFDELAVWLETELAHLPRRQREVFALYLEGFDDPDIAEALCIRRATVRQHRRAARRTLRARWEARQHGEDGTAAPRRVPQDDDENGGEEES